MFVDSKSGDIDEKHFNYKAKLKVHAKIQLAQNFSEASPNCPRSTFKNSQFLEKF